MIIKPGASINGIQPELVLALLVCERVFRRYTDAPVVLTSAVDPAKGRVENSLHPSGWAIDVRKPSGNVVPRIVLDLNEALGAEFDVVLEEDHIHVEFDPE